MRKLNYRDYAGALLLKGVFLLIPLLFSAPSHCQDPLRNASRLSAFAAFEKNDFETAYSNFSALSGAYPKDPLYKYYSGVCLVKLERDPEKASNLLNESIKGSGTIRSVPQDALFYLGRAQQMAGRFREAAESYDSFTLLAGRKVAREMNVPDYIRDCEEGKGRVESNGAIPGQGGGKPGKTPAGKFIPDTSAKNLRKSESLPPDLDKRLEVALEYRTGSDSAERKAEKLKAELSAADPQSRNALRQKITGTEKEAVLLRKKAEMAMKDSVAEIGNAEKPVTVGQGLQRDTAAVTVETDRVKAVKPDTFKSSEGDSIRIFSEFRVVAKPVFRQGDKVVVDPPVPPGLVYRIQVAVFRNPVSPAYFKGLEPVQGFRNPSTGVTTYYAGMFRRQADAMNALARVKSVGFRDSFVASLVDKKPVSSERAAILEKEWGSKPLYVREPRMTETPKDTVPPTLVFRVEVKRAPKPLPSDQVESMRKMSASRGFDIYEPAPKQYVYLIGSFLSFRSASEFADLLIRNGYREAKVVAYLGKREIPVETARKLFEEY